MIIMLWLLDFVWNWGWLVVIVLVVIGVLICNLFKQLVLWLLWYKWLLIVLLFGKFVCGYNIVWFVSMLVILMSVGVLILWGLQVVGEMLNNVVFKINVEDVFMCVWEGILLVWVLVVQNQFLFVLVYLICLGEVMGNLFVMLEWVVQGEVQELECCMLFLIGLLELVLILMMGVVVLLIVLVVFMLIIEIN